MQPALPMPKAVPTAPREAYSVSALARVLKQTLEGRFPMVWVEGELSNFSCPASGHWYFSLKDERAQLRCAMFKGNSRGVRTSPQNGDQLLVRGRISVYDRRGDLQLICDHLEPAGTGALQREFERLKLKLAAEGLFDPERRRPLPPRPRRIGVITSGTGAALQDILDTLGRRWPLAEICLWPTPVQGASAAPAIATALAGLPRRVSVDLIILARGGGSLEDLWAFNEESVARAVRACTVPVVTGVGHETDTTIVDFVADLRAPTPTAAAERVTPDAAELLAYVNKLEATTRNQTAARHARAVESFEMLTSRLRRQHPQRVLQDAAQAVDELGQRLERTLRQQQRVWRQTLTRNHERLARQHPRRVLDEGRRRLAETGARLPSAWQYNTATLRHRLSLADARLVPARLNAGFAHHRQLLDGLQRRLDESLRHELERNNERLRRSTRLLETLGPNAVLARGFSLATDAKGRVLRDVRAVHAGQAVKLRLHRGSIAAEVRRTWDTTPSD